MKKLFLLAAVLVFSLTLCAGTTQMAVFLTGKNAHLRVLDKGGFNVKERTKWDKKTGTVIYRCFFFNITARSTSEMRKMTLKFEAAKGDLAVYIGHKRADKMLWTSLKIDGKEQVKDPKKGEVIGIKQFPIGKIDKNKSISLEATYRMTSKKDLQAQKSASKKSSKKNSKKSK